MLAHARSRLVVASVLLLACVGWLAGDGETPADLLKAAQQALARNEDNRAWEALQKLVQQFPDAPEVLEARWRMAEYCTAHHNTWRVVDLLQAGLAKADTDPAWRARYRFELGKAMVAQQSGDRRAVEYLGEVAKGFEEDGNAASRDLALFALARAHVMGVDQSAGDRAAHDLERWEMVARTYARILAAHDGEGEVAARARYELATLRGRMRLPPTGALVLYPTENTAELSAVGKDHVARLEADATAALAGLDEVERLHPGTAWAGSAAFARGWIHEHTRHDLPAALAAYRAMATAHARHPDASTATRRALAIAAQELQLGQLGAVPVGTKPKIPVRVRNLKEITWRIYKVALDELLAAGGAVERRLRPGQDLSVQECVVLALADARTAPTATFWWTTGCADDHVGRSTTLELPFAEAGTYLIEGGGDQVTTRMLVVITDVEVQLVPGEREVLAMVSDRKTRAPISGARVVGLVQGYDAQNTWRAVAVDGKTGADGMLLASADLASMRYQRFRLAAARGADAALLEAMDHGAQGSGLVAGEHRVFITTDRPLYRPQSTGHYKIVARSVGEEGYGNLAGKAARVTITDPRGDKIHERSAALDAMGAIDGRFEIGEKATLGPYRIQVQVEERASAWYGQDQAGSFQVEEYKKPEFQVTIAPGRGDYRPGDEVEVVLEARYYHGQPVRMATVNWQLSFAPHVALVPPPFELASPPGGGSYGEWAQHAGAGSGVTDEDGRLAIRWKTPAQGTASRGRPEALRPRGVPEPPEGPGDGEALESDDGGGPADRRWTVVAQVVDKSRRQVEGAGQLLVTARALEVTLKAPANLVRPGVEVPLTLATRAPSGKAVSCAGFVTARRAVGKDWVLVSRQDARTDDRGAGEVRFAPPVAGLYRLDFATGEAAQAPPDASAYFFAVGAGYAAVEDLALTSGDHRLVPEHAGGMVGQRLRFLVRQPGYTGVAFAVVGAGRAIFARQAVSMADGAGVFEVELANEHVPVAHVVVVIPGRPPIPLAQPIRVTAPASALSVSLELDRPRYRPGEKAVAKVTVRDAQGQPAAGACWLTAYDESLLAIAPEPAGDIRAHFYGHWRTWLMGLHSSGHWSTSGREERRASYYGLDDAGPEWLRWNVGGWFAGINHGRYWSVVDAPPAKDPGAPPPSSRPGPNAPSDRDEAASEKAMARAQGEGRAGAPGGGAVPVVYKPAVVRKNFTDTAVWAMVTTDARGEGRVEFAFPDNITGWRFLARACSPSAAVGQVSRTIEVAKQLMVRLATPRFFTERDQVVVSAIVSNDLLVAAPVKVVLTLTGGALALGKTGATTHEREITLAPKKDYRADWRLDVRWPGEATVEVQALSVEESDAVRMSFPVVRHGIDKHAGVSGAIVGTGKAAAGDVTAREALEVPAARDVASTRLRVVLSPSVAGVALEALPYLASYPYGCVEQTMSRFGPTVQVKRALVRLGIPIEEITGDKPGRTLPAGIWGKPHYAKFGCVRQAELDELVEAGVARLVAFQQPDGGWGWWRHGGGDAYMTAYVLDGLMTARDADVAIAPSVIERALACVYRQLGAVDLSRFDPEDPRKFGEGELERLAWSACAATRSFAGRGEVERSQVAVLVRHLAREAERLGPYARLLTALALAQTGQTELAERALAAVLALATTDPRNGDVTWTKGQDWCSWWHDPVETVAYGVRAVLRIKPDAPELPGLVKHLVHLRSGARWHSTKATAIAIGALVEYLATSGELDPDYEVVVRLGGREIGRAKFDRKNLLDAESTIAVMGEGVPTGAAELTLEKVGRGNLYYSAFVDYYSLEEPIPAAGHRIAVSREYVKVSTQGGLERREKLASGAALVSGDVIEVALVLDSDRDYEYVALEERKAAGLEPERQTSGPGEGIATHIEMRDDRVVVFASRVPKGLSRIVYRCRAEVPGDFHALPLTGYLMYAPDIRANSDEFRVEVRDE